MASYSKKIKATEKISLGTGADGAVSRIVFQVVDDGSLSTSMVVKGRVLGQPDAELLSIPYTNRASGATVAAGTAITAEGMWEADATGIEVVLDNTFTSGAGTVYFQPVVG